LDVDFEELININFMIGDGSTTIREVLGKSFHEVDKNKFHIDIFL
jgi:hypothetical protein